MSSEASDPHGLTEDGDADEAIDLVGGGGGDVIAYLEYKNIKDGVTEGKLLFILFYQIFLRLSRNCHLSRGDDPIWKRRRLVCHSIPP